TVPPGVLLDLRPDFQLEQTQAPKILAIRFNDSLTDRAKVGKPIDVHVVAFVDVAGKVPLQPDQVQVFVEDLDSGQFLYGGFKLEGGALIVQEPGYYRIKAVIEGKNVQGGAASTTKQVRVR
ncbi:MAG: hypothetical protein R3194_12770, partial [Limnobacter sp.]|nr:hypothetical protein [Limnobacter sp.]